MNVQSWRCLRGPNVWAPCPVFEGVIDFGDEGSPTARRLHQILDRVAETFPGMALPPVGGAPFRLAHTLASAALLIQNRARTPVSFSTVRPGSRPGRCMVAVEFAVEPVGRAALDLAWRLLLAARDDFPLALHEEEAQLARIEWKNRFYHSSRIIFEAARARGIPAARLSPEYSRFLRLGQGSRQRRFFHAEPDNVSAMARSASTNKHFAKLLMQAAGVPVPLGKLVCTAEEAWAAACELGLPVIVKPFNTDQALGVSLDLRSCEQVEAAFHQARQFAEEMLVERFLPGVEHRVLVTGNRVAVVTRIDPPQVIGDGVSTVAELIERANSDPRRVDENVQGALHKLKIDEQTPAALAAQGYTFDSRPPAGQRVLVRRNPPYFSAGGTLTDETDRIHPRNVELALAAARALQIPVAGLDVLALDIGVPLEDQDGVIIEINTGPGLWIHLPPCTDAPRPIGECIVETLFPPGEDGRIPIVALVNDRDGVAAAHLTGLLTRVALRVGIASPAGLVVGGRRWSPPADNPWALANVLMADTTVDVALLHTHPCELVRSGFGTDRCDVALVLDPTHEADSEDGPAPAEFAGALRHALAPAGAYVVPADVASSLRDPAPLASAIILVAPEPGPTLEQHLSAGGRALVLQGSRVALARGMEALAMLGDLPEGTSGPGTKALLAALAAGLALGHGAGAVSSYLRSLRCERPPG